MIDLTKISKTNTQLEKYLQNWEARRTSKLQGRNDLILGLYHNFDKPAFQRLLPQLVTTEYHLRSCDMSIEVIKGLLAASDRENYYISFFDTVLTSESQTEIEQKVRNAAEHDIMKLATSQESLMTFLQEHNIPLKTQKPYPTTIQVKNKGLFGKPCENPYVLCSHHRCYLSKKQMKYRKCKVKHCRYLFYLADLNCHHGEEIAL